MNKRIEELVEQATEEEHYYGCYGDNCYTNKLNPEKFAELIVRECIDVISPYALHMENFDGGHPIADIKKHFGVE